MIYKRYLDEYAIKHDMFYTNRQLRANGQTFQNDQAYQKVQNMICQDINSLDATMKEQFQRLIGLSYPRSHRTCI